MHHLLKHPAMTVVTILVVAISFNVFTKSYDDGNRWSANSSRYTSMTFQGAAADRSAVSAEIAQDYALATGAWIPSSMTVQSPAPDQKAESAEIAQDYALATGAWIPSRPN